MQIFKVTYQGKDVAVLAYFEKHLCGVSLNCEHPLPHRVYFMNKVPVHCDSIELLQTRFPNSQIEEVVQEPIFDDFWNAYDHKHDRPLALKKWDKLSPSDRFAAYNGIKRYDAYLAVKGIAKLYPVRYLDRRTWENDLDVKLKLKK